MSAPIRFCLLALLVLGAGSCAKKGDPVEAAKAFFSLIASERTDEAYATTALQFQAQQSAKLFAQTTKELGLMEFASMTSAPPEYDGNSAKLQIEVTSRDHKKSSLAMTMVEERGSWRVFSVRAPRSTQTGIAANLFGTVGKGPGFTDSVSHPMPSEEEVRRMVEDTLMLFNRCVQRGSFDDLYDAIAAAWQEQVTKGQIKRAFQGFLDMKADVSGIHGKQATFLDPPAITTEGLLTAQGHYPIRPAHVLFAMKFKYETPKWKLFGLDVSLATPGE